MAQVQATALPGTALASANLRVFPAREGGWHRPQTYLKPPRGRIMNSPPHFLQSVELSMELDKNRTKVHARVKDSTGS